MKTYKIMLLPLLLILLSSIAPVLAQTVTIGVQPSAVTIDFNKYPAVHDIEFHFFNDKGDTDAYYYLEPDKCLETIIGDYPKQVFVPKGTTRLENPVKVVLKFAPDYTGDKNCSLIIYALPSNATSGAISIRPSVAVKFTIYQPKIILWSETTVTQSSGSSGAPSGAYRIATNSTVTTTTNTTKPTQTPSPTEVNTTTTTIRNATVSSETQTTTEYKIELAPFLLGVLTVAVIVVIIYLIRSYPITLPFVLLLLAMPLASATTQQINVTVNVTEAPPPPPTPPLEVRLLSMTLPILVAISILAFTLKALSPEKDAKYWIYLITSIVIAILLLGFLVASI